MVVDGEREKSPDVFVFGLLRGEVASPRPEKCIVLPQENKLKAILFIHSKLQVPRRFSPYSLVERAHRRQEDTCRDDEYEEALRFHPGARRRKIYRSANLQDTPNTTLAVSSTSTTFLNSTSSKNSAFFRLSCCRNLPRSLQIFGGVLIRSSPHIESRY